MAPLFFDESTATVANVGNNYGQTTTLMLTDPDSNEVVPQGARLGGDFMVTSQGDRERITSTTPEPPPEPLGPVAFPVCRRHRVAEQFAGNAVFHGLNERLDRQRPGPFVPNQPVVAATPCGPTALPRPAQRRPSIRPASLARSTPVRVRSPPSPSSGPPTCPRVGSCLSPGVSTPPQCSSKAPVRLLEEREPRAERRPCPGPDVAVRSGPRFVRAVTTSTLVLVNAGVVGQLHSSR